MASPGKEFKGKGEKLHEAIQDAWSQAPKSGQTTYEVTKIFVEGNNPLTGYVVVLSAPGG